ncbi:MAG: DUF805 domain-containing protein [Acidaminococcus sp.]|jgi:uncharacterized membrane protein YhaH (DUF805 family)|nr:DUF805 domain-containing protein [Acidaminococcus sp.]MCI2099694.1 DUF805 domain-containing protein [Acidaminococcus sp.]MCI2113902.1 DUF805 domain-containing protein [Acidaminococcus sp.]MCI2115862.1 DUF805 domain-containing protein [Acidaminococcus sp.]
MAGFCTQCGREIPDGARFCPNCGAPVADAQAQSSAGAAGEAWQGRKNTASGPQQKAGYGGAGQPDGNGCGGPGNGAQGAAWSGTQAGPGESYYQGNGYQNYGYGNAGGPAVPPTYEGTPEDSLQDVFLRTRGRLNRKRYLMRSIVFTIAFMVMALIFGDDDIFSDTNVAFDALVNLLTLPLDIRRVHDLNKSGWFAALLFVPIFGNLYYLYLLFAKGTVGPNRFGPDPLQRPDLYKQY